MTGSFSGPQVTPDWNAMRRDSGVTRVRSRPMRTGWNPIRRQQLAEHALARCSEEFDFGEADGLGVVRTGEAQAHEAGGLAQGDEVAGVGLIAGRLV